MEYGAGPGRRGGLTGGAGLMTGGCRLISDRLYAVSLLVNQAEEGYLLSPAAIVVLFDHSSRRQNQKLLVMHHP